MSEAFEIEWNTANEKLQALLARDPALNGYAVEVDPLRLLVIVEPGQELSAASVAEVAIANRLRPVVIVEGVTPKAKLDRAFAAIGNAARRIRAPQDTKGLTMRIDYLYGKVRITGDLEHGRAIANEAGIGDDLLIVEDGPGVSRRMGPPPTAHARP